MSKNYVIDWMQCETEFNGDKVTYQARPLDLEKWLFLEPFTKVVGKEVKVEIEPFEMPKIAKDVLPGFVQNINGFTINNESPSIEQLTNGMGFVKLVSEMVLKLMSISMINEEESKNSEGLSTTPQLERSNTGS